MFNKPLLYSVAAFVLAALLALGAAMAMTTLVEHRNTSALRAAMTEAGLTWVSVQPDGLNVTLGGSAPDESARIRALQVAGAVMDASRISETIAVARHAAVVAPVFRIEVMRNRDEISVIGLVPADEGDNPITDRLSAALPGARVEDMLQTSDYAVPGGWVAAEAFAVEALQRFRVGRISVSAGRIEVEDADPGAHLDHDLGIGAPDPGRSPGDDDRFAGHVEHRLQGHVPHSSRIAIA